MAIALGLLLLDAAVETLLLGAPIRWIVLGITAVSLVLAGLLYLRLGWAGSAITALLAFLALLALTAWLPGGSERGVTLLRQPTPVVLAATCGLALLGAAGIFAAARILPLPARAALALLALYGAAAFIQGAMQLVPFAGLFHGQSLWTRLPWWLQGAFIGGLVILPVVLLAQVVAALRTPRRFSRAGFATVAWGMVIVLAISGLRVQPGTAINLSPQPSGAVASTPPVPSSAQPAPAASPQGVSGQPSAEQEKVRKDYLDALAKLKASIDYSKIDVQALQKKLGTDPQALAKFVQNEIRFEPYAGVLRGPRGTLLARAGNSLDRALLLQSLLQLAGHKGRLVGGTLSQVQAEHLVRGGFPPRPVPELKPQTEEIIKRAKSHFIILGDALSNDGFRAPMGDAGVWDRTVNETRQHFWVRLQAGGPGIDIDTSPGVAYGQALVQSDTERDEPDPRLLHRIEIRMEVEAVRDGKPEITTVLEYAAPAADYSGLPVGIYHDRGADSSTPVLIVGDKVVKGSPFKSPVILKGLGGASALNPFSAGSSEGLRAERLHIRVLGPSGERRATYPIVETGVLGTGPGGGAPQQSSAENDRIVSEALDAFLGIAVATGQVPFALLASNVADATDPVSEAGAIRLLTTPGYLYHVLRGALPPSFLATAPLWYIDSPFVVLTRAQPESPAASIVVSMDLFIKAYRTLRTPEDPLQKRGLFYDYLSAGALDHTLERWVLGPDGATGSVGFLFETTIRQGVATRVLLRGKAIPNLPLTPSGQRRLGAELDSGQVVIIPAGPVNQWKSAFGWWTVDPTTGWAEDTTENGYHSQAERGTIQWLVNRPAWKFVCVLGLWVGFAGAMGVVIFKGEEHDVSDGLLAFGAYATAVCETATKLAPTKWGGF